MQAERAKIPQSNIWGNFKEMSCSAGWFGKNWISLKKNKQQTCLYSYSEYAESGNKNSCLMFCDLICPETASQIEDWTKFLCIFKTIFFLYLIT